MIFSPGHSDTGISKMTKNISKFDSPIMGHNTPGRNALGHNDQGHNDMIPKRITPNNNRHGGNYGRDLPIDLANGCQ